MTAEDRLAALRAKVDDFFGRVAARYPGELVCGPGCSDCCRRELTVTAVEASSVARAVRAMPPGARAELSRRAREGAPCAALADDGRCAVYDARPIVCRSHGVPLRFEEPAPSGKRALPVLDACFKNFTTRDLAALDPACVLDQRTLSVLLGAIDALFAQETASEPGARPSLREVLLAAAESP